MSFDLSSSVAYEKQSLVLRVLELALSKVDMLPAQGFSSKKEFKQYLANEYTLLIDVIEQRIQRPSNQERQKKDYSGKKIAYPKTLMHSLLK